MNMNLHKLSEYKRVLMVFAVLILLLVGVVLVRYGNWSSIFQQKGSGRYFLEFDKAELRTGEEAAMTVYFNAPGEVLDGADVILRFDPSLLVVTSIEEGKYFDQYLRKEIDNTAGNIKVTGFMSSVKASQQPVMLFKAKARAKRAGNAFITFDFQKGLSSKSTLVQKGTSKNILSEVTGSNLTILP